MNKPNVIVTFQGRIVSKEDVENSADMKRALPAQDQFHRVYREVKDRPNPGQYTIYVSEAGIRVEKEPPRLAADYLF